MKATDQHHERIAHMSFATVYPLYVNKIERKGRTVNELHQVIQWLTGFSEKDLQKLIERKATFEEFFKKSKTSSKCSTHNGHDLRLSY